MRGRLQYGGRTPNLPSCPLKSKVTNKKGDANFNKDLFFFLTEKLLQREKRCKHKEQLLLSLLISFNSGGKPCPVCKKKGTLTSVHSSC